jgi:outer membrane protein OmpA-like peptidoglycan-associated protein
LYLNPEEDISFYGVGGAGNLSTDFAGFSESVPMANIGAGVKGRFSGKSLFWRVDARYRIDEYNGFPPEERLRDWVFNVGLLIPLGKKDETISTTQEKVVPTQNPFDNDNDGVANDVDKCADTLAGVQVNVLGCEYDTDRDGVVDSQDKCAGTPLYVKVDSKGCDFYDLDKDGIEDDKDKCPETPSGIKVNELGCELDSDKDWVVDSQDECPETAPGIEVGANGCERDTDQDGIVDSQDKCPDTKPGQAVNNTGCELPSVPDVIVLEGVSFKYNSAELSSGSSAVLNKAVETLKSQTNLMIEVAGHSDSVGNPEYNRHLSYLRAVAVMDYLVEHGVPSLNLSAKGYGDKSPIASNESSEGRAKNRRVELRIIGQQ